MALALQFFQENGFEHRSDRVPGVFDDRYVDLQRGEVQVTIERARSALAVTIWDGFDWADVGLWEACISKIEPRADLPPLLEQASFVIANFRAISAVAQHPTPEFHDALKAAGRRRFEANFSTRDVAADPARTEAVLSEARRLAIARVASLRERGVDVSALETEPDTFRLLARLSEIDRKLAEGT